MDAMTSLRKSIAWKWSKALLSDNPPDNGRYIHLDSPSTAYKPAHGGYPTPGTEDDLIVRLNDAQLTGKEMGETFRALAPSHAMSPAGALCVDEYLRKEFVKYLSGLRDCDPHLSYNEWVNARIASEIVAQGGPRAKGYNYGGSNSNLPSLYFDAASLANILRSKSSMASARSWKLEDAMRKCVSPRPTRRSAWPSRTFPTSSPFCGMRMPAWTRPCSRNSCTIRLPSIPAQSSRPRFPRSRTQSPASFKRGSILAIFQGEGSALPFRVRL